MYKRVLSMKPYTQSTKFTCAASSLAMIINHFNPRFPLSEESEFDIWQKSAALPLRGSSLFGLALYAHDQGLPVRLVVGEKKFKFPGYRFKAYKKKEVELAHKSSQFFLKKLKKSKVPIEERDFDLEEVKSLLEKDKVLLMRVIIGILRQSDENKRTSHYIPVTSYKNNHFEIFDPRHGKKLVPEMIFQQSFNKIKEVKRDNRMIILG